MKEIKIYIDDDCSMCAEGLAYLEKLHKTRGKNPTLGIKLNPDYNASGILTHFHIELIEPKNPPCQTDECEGNDDTCNFNPERVTDCPVQKYNLRDSEKHVTKRNE